MIEQKFWPKNLTDAVITAAAERQMFGLDNPGFCLACGAEVEGVEPDARRYRCEACGSRQVYGAEELVMHLDRITEPKRIKLWMAGESGGD